jgi:hypothetical protein
MKTEIKLLTAKNTFANDKKNIISKKKDAGNVGALPTSQKHEFFLIKS